MLPPLTTVAAMEARLGLTAGDITGNDLVRAEQALLDASSLVRAESADLTWVAEDDTTITAPHDVIVVTLQSALRVYRNPDGYTGESVGDYSYQFGQAHGSVDVYLNAEEKALIHAAVDRVQGRGFTGSIGVPSAYSSPSVSNPLTFEWGLD